MTKYVKVSGGGEPDAYFVFYGERFRNLSKAQFDKRIALAKFSGGDPQIGEMHPWALAAFVMDFKLVADPKA